MIKTFVSYEMQDGTEHENVRVLAADKVRAEGICRDNGWQLVDGPRLSVAIAYAAAKRTESTDCANVADFMDQLADYALSNEQPEDDGEPDPT
ncbi:hypothetical protein [Brachybacterium tyrofermentans]|uniref:hypothetical protein n=1 Tax=Brachybacterium tyrofermentans TaxID=47848 RepID=UPI003FD6A486